MVQESRTAKLIRGLVKFVFIACYAAFMWASIHHVATYFDNFEQNGASNLFGSYLLAGAFDITALVTTIGVMFFRKSMPRYVQVIVWIFIVAIAGYSFFINWEYAAHFQNADLVLQATGATTPVFDTQGHLHYVMVMRANTALLVVNPLLASGFTLFSLIYSIVAEFFGTKAPTVEELQARKTYLEQTATVLESIKQLEDKSKGKGLTATLKERALEVKSAWKEVTHSEETEYQPEFTESDEEPSIQASETIQSSETDQSIQDESEVQNRDQPEVEDRSKDRESAKQHERWDGFTGRSTVTLEKAAELLNVSITTIVTLRNKGALKTAALNKHLITVASLKAYDLKRSQRKQSRYSTEAKPRLKIVTK